MSKFIMNFDIFEWYWVIILGWIGLNYLIILVYTIIYSYTIRKKINKLAKRKTYIDKNLEFIQWKLYMELMNNDIKIREPIYKLRFYISRFNIFLLMICLSIYIYKLEIVGIYIEILSYSFIGITILEYIFYLYSLNQTIYPNYNLIYNNITSIIIPFGGGIIKDKIPITTKVCAAACVLVGPDKVYLVHNGRSNKPAEYESLKLLKETYGLNYLYLPFGNKTMSIDYVTRHIVNDKQILIIDDDVILPYNLIIPELNNVECVAYPISASMSTNSGLLVNFQNIEYGLAGMIKISQSRWSEHSSTLSHHGAIGLWNRDALLKVLWEHNTNFDGEDLLMGIRSLKNNYVMKVIDHTFVPTETPSTFMQLARQRIRSWDFIILDYVWIYLKLIFIGPCFDNIVLKFFVFHELWTIFLDFQRLPLIAYMLYNNWFIFSLYTGIFMVINILMSLWFNYMTLPYGQRSSLISILLYPFYKIITIGFRLLGHLFYILRYRDTKIRHPIILSCYPELPDLLKLGSLNSIEWDKIYDDTSYIKHKTINSDINSQFEEIEARLREINNDLNV